MPRILAVSDSVDPSLYDHFNPDRWLTAGIDLIISCGDLKAEYLSYLVSRFNLPLLYVPGNHDGEYKDEPPEGGESIDGRFIVWKGLRILGLGGAPLYNTGPQQYSEGAMARRILKAKPTLWWNKGVDLVVTHAPPRHCPLAYGLCSAPAGVGRDCIHPLEAERTMCNDATDLAHRGFPALTDLIHQYHPRALLHGHSHLSYGMAKRVVDVEGTKVVDAHGYYILDL
jgi:Icc-related predicted phosphoesterase